MPQLAVQKRAVPGATPEAAESVLREVLARFADGMLYVFPSGNRTDKVSERFFFLPE